MAPCRTFTAGGATKRLSVMVGPSQLFCLAASGDKVLIAS